MVLLITGTTGIAAATAELARSHGASVFTAGLDAPADFVADLCEPGAADEALRLLMNKSTTS